MQTLAVCYLKCLRQEEALLDVVLGAVGGVDVLQARVAALDATVPLDRLKWLQDIRFLKHKSYDMHPESDMGYEVGLKLHEYHLWGLPLGRGFDFHLV